VKQPRRHYRKYGSIKNTRLFKARVPEEVFDFFDANSLNDEGQERSRGEILEVLVRSAKNKVRDREEKSGVSHS
jgi:hypothetical protein